MKYQDKFTKKVFTVKSNKVYDEFGNVATVPSKEWLELQGDDVIKLEMKKTRAAAGRDLFGAQVHRGSVCMLIDTSSQELEEIVSNEMSELGFDSIVGEESEHYEDGICSLYYISSSDVDDFNSAYKEVKNKVLK